MASKMELNSSGLKAKKLPRLYTKSDDDKTQIREGDVDEIDSADTMKDEDYVPHATLLTGVVTKLRKKGLPTKKG